MCEAEVRGRITNIERSADRTLKGQVVQCSFIDFSRPTSSRADALVDRCLVPAGAELLALALRGGMAAARAHIPTPAPAKPLMQRDARKEMKAMPGMSGLLWVGVYTVFLLGLTWSAPGYVVPVWSLTDLTDVAWFGLPLEELLFALTFGCCRATVYRHFARLRVADPGPRRAANIHGCGISMVGLHTTTYSPS